MTLGECTVGSRCTSSIIYDHRLDRAEGKSLGTSDADAKGKSSALITQFARVTLAGSPRTPWCPGQHRLTAHPKGVGRVPPGKASCTMTAGLSAFPLSFTGIRFLQLIWTSWEAAIVACALA